jgi:hypothetical protein
MLRNKLQGQVRNIRQELYDIVQIVPCEGITLYQASERTREGIQAIY